MAPSLIVQRRFHPLMSAQFEGPVARAIDEDDYGDHMDGLHPVARREGLRAAALAGPRVLALLRRLNLPVIGVYHAARYAFELRWPVDQGRRYYMLCIESDRQVNLGKLYGRYFGYPECCTDHMGCWFTLPGFEGSILDGTGFVPCEHCHATRPPQELVASIQAHRICASPFPEVAHPILDDFWCAEAVAQGRLQVPVCRARRKA